MRLTSFSYSPSLTPNPRYSLSRASYYPAFPPEQVTFGAKKPRRWVRNTAAAFALATTAAYATAGLFTTLGHIEGCASTGKVVVTHTDQPWPKNMNILTSSMPNQLSYFNDSGSFYVNSLISTLNEDGVKSLEDAHNRLAEKGIPYTFLDPKCLRQAPAPLPNSLTGAWPKGDTSTNRYVLLLAEKPNTSMEKSGWESDFTNLKETLNKTYGVPDTNFMAFGQITQGQDFYKAFAQFRTFIAEQEGGKIVGNGTLVLPKNKRPPEILIFYTGHGGVNLNGQPRNPEDYKYMDPNQVPAAGQSGVSYWVTGFGESELRAQFSPMYWPSSVNILAVINSCYSGNNAD